MIASANLSLLRVVGMDLYGSLIEDFLLMTGNQADLCLGVMYKCDSDIYGQDFNQWQLSFQMRAELPLAEGL